MPAANCTLCEGTARPDLDEVFEEDCGRLKKDVTEETSATLTNPNLLLALGRLGEPTAVEPLRRAVENSSEATAKIAAQALAEHPHADAFSALMGMLDTGSDAVLNAVAPAVVLRKDKAACASLSTAQERAPDNKALRAASTRS